MSTTQIAVLGRGRPEPPRALPDSARTRGMTMTAFMFLAVYGTMRWGTMLEGSFASRLAGLLLLTLVIAWLGGHIAATRLWARVTAWVGIIAAALAIIPVSGFPLRWLLHLKIARLAHSIGHGLSSLPHVIVPYSGPQMATGAVIALGAGMLLLAGALALCTSGSRVGQARLVAAAVPLIVLAIVPTVLSEPKVAALHGAILFLGLLALLFSERVSPERVAGALVFTLLGALLALILAPTFESSGAWINVKKIGSGHVRVAEQFDWNQTYGPLSWPRRGTQVLSVQARFPRYWKAEDLDLFDGRGWQSSSVGEGPALAGVSRSSLRRWSESLHVTLSTMSSSDVIASGVATSPPRANGIQLAAGSDTGFLPIPGTAPGTWQSETQMTAGTSYRVQVYSPEPSTAELASAPARYPIVDLAPELGLRIPLARTATAGPAQEASVEFRPFGSRKRFATYAGLAPVREAAQLASSVYAPVFRLAERLRAGAHTPYAYVEAVLHYLGHGFAYDQNTRRSAYPLLTFLLRTHRGYCQQYAGAMALLLRMGGIPARVATGFTSGTYDRGARDYQVSDLDAHAWVEAWFAHYGWVTFDPTPSSDPALSGTSPLPAVQSSSAGLRPHPSAVTHNRRSGAAAPTGPRHREQTRAHPSGGVSALPILLAVLAAVGLGLAAAWLVRRTPLTAEGYVAELERAFVRTRRPLPAQVTLAGLERRFADTPEAAAYVRSLAQARFADAPARPSAEGRRALRRRLRRGLGPAGWLWALVALPPLVRRLH
jgi:hypothetical protein